MSRWYWLVAGGLTAFLVAVVPVRVRGVGSADLSITVRPAGQLQPAWVEVVAVTRADIAETIASRTPPSHGGIVDAAQNPFTGGPIRLAVKVTSDDSHALLWSRRRHYQMQAVVVVWQPADGPQQAKAVCLPDLRTTRAIVVDLP